MSDDTITITFTADEILDWVAALNYFVPDNKLAEFEQVIQTGNWINKNVTNEIEPDLRKEFFEKKAQADEQILFYRRLVALRGRLTE